MPVIVIISLAVIGFIVFLAVSKTTYRQYRGMGTFIFVVAIAAVIGTQSVASVGANKVGIIFDPLLGGVQEYTLNEGFHLKSPIAHVYIIDTEVQSVNLIGLNGQTKDSQYLNISVDVKYKVNTSNAFTVFKNFRSLDRVNNELITPFTQRAIESVTTKYNIIEILGEDRNNVYAEIENELAERFETNGVTLHSVTFTDTDAGDTIEAAIEAEAAAKKEVDIAEQKKIKASIEKEEQIIRAEADKEQKILEAQGEAESIRIIQEQLAKDPTYIDYVKWSRWDGALPEVLGESDILLSR